MDFALKFALDMSILSALSKEIPQGRRRLDGPVWSKCHFEMSWFKMYGFRAPPKMEKLREVF